MDAVLRGEEREPPTLTQTRRCVCPSQPTQNPTHLHPHHSGHEQRNYQAPVMCVQNTGHTQGRIKGRSMCCGDCSADNQVRDKRWEL
jgi:hypothetical protein